MTQQFHPKMYIFWWPLACIHQEVCTGIFTANTEQTKTNQELKWKGEKINSGLFLQLQASTGKHGCKQQAKCHKVFFKVERTNLTGYVGRASNWGETHKDATGAGPNTPVLSRLVISHSCVMAVHTCAFHIFVKWAIFRTRRGENETQHLSSPQDHFSSGTFCSLKRNLLVKGSQYWLPPFSLESSQNSIKDTQNQKGNDLFWPQSKIYSRKISAPTACANRACNSTERASSMLFVRRKIPAPGHSTLAREKLPKTS